jgi:hypothetical protein
MDNILNPHYQATVHSAAAEPLVFAVLHMTAKLGGFLG